MIIIDGEAVDRPRLHSLTERVESKFGVLYCHVEFNDLGAIHGLSISYPGKHMEKEVGDALDALNMGLNRLIETARGKYAAR